LLAILVSSCFKEKKSDIAAGKMQDFIIDISRYARGFNNDFIIIPQNGIELAFNNTDPAEGPKEDYLNAIDGIGVEELFYDGGYAPDGERLSMLQELKDSKKILVADYVKNNADISDALSLNLEEGFICFPRSSQNYDYLELPEILSGENTGNISRLADAQNYLYLISTDKFSSKQDMLNAISSSNYDLVLIDLFFNEQALSAEDVNSLKTKANGGSRLVIAYMNIGSAEKFRYYWGKNWGLHHPLWIKRKYEGYDDEFWVKFWKPEWQDIIYGNDNSYCKKIIDAGFDGAYLDNVEAYYFVYFKN
ncbi:MAG: endo alpha-1,4 polygalactosaminidase, partial [Bacteroidales bacterium]|nr:endo alpha-1,4 polygalactosaminidase [Bacteroidales bacterium]